MDESKLSEFARKRFEICKACPLYKVDEFYGPVCDKSKYISPDGKRASYFKKSGWIQGCGCHLDIKINNSSKHCIVNKW